MPVPNVITDLSPDPVSNYPVGSETPSSMDNYLRAHAAFIRQNYNFATGLLGTSGEAADALIELGAAPDDEVVHLTGDETIAGVKTFTSAPVFPQSMIDEYQWLGTPIGGMIELRTDLAGIVAPPTNNPKFRYIKLTASDAYNAGALTSESVTGSAPLITATAVISLTGSPMNGETVDLENTMRTFSRAGNPGVVQNDSFQGHTFSTTTQGAALGEFGINASSGGTLVAAFRTSQATVASIASDVTSGNPRVANETRPRNIGKELFMRIM